MKALNHQLKLTIVAVIFIVAPVALVSLVSSETLNILPGEYSYSTTNSLAFTDDGIVVGNRQVRNKKPASVPNNTATLEVIKIGVNNDTYDISIPIDSLSFGTVYMARVQLVVNGDILDDVDFFTLNQACGFCNTLSHTFTGTYTSIGSDTIHIVFTARDSGDQDNYFSIHSGTTSSLGGPAAPPAPTGQTSSGGQTMGTINVVKTVINDNGGTKTVAGFPLFVNGTPVVSGATNIFPGPATVFTVTETSDPNYAQTFSGDCNSNGQINLAQGDNRFCIVTNDDIGMGFPNTGSVVPPLIDVVKVPSPLALPAGPGPVMYTYTLRNVGIVPVTDVTMVGDTCSSIVLVSGDINGDAKLDVNETWIHTCTTTLSATHTNTIVATGWANGINAVDIASSTVIVGIPIVPPLIHVVKIASPLTLPSSGGMVTYTEIVTNPGPVPLSNIKLTDDKCGPVKYVSGDTNSDSKLNTTEAWIYTCKIYLTETTTNTAIASGESDGLTVKDLAIVTVVVADVVPAMPNAGAASPLIHVTKVPNPPTLFAGGGIVTYTEIVTNPGKIILSNIELTDDKCSPMKYVSGDRNVDSKLNTTEAWIYTCQANLTKTTTNTATVSGKANGVTVKAFATATVVVANALPDTDSALGEKNIFWNILMLVIIFTVLMLLLYFGRKRQIT